MKPSIDEKSSLPEFKDVKSFEQAAQLLKAAVAPLGFPDFNYGCVNFADSLISTMDPVWIAHYREQQLWRTDPLVVEARKRVAPFFVSDIFVIPAQNSATAQMEKAISEVPRGIVVPIHCPRVGASLASYLTPMDDAALRADATRLMGTLAVISLRFHEAVTHLYETGTGTDTQAGLTKREREVLTLASRGKSSRDIGLILSISETTANNHIGRILRKFNVATRAQAIALALQTGQIERSN